MKNHPVLLTIIALLILITACVNNPPQASTDNPQPTTTPALTEAPPFLGNMLESLDPQDIMVQQDYEPGFFRPETYYEFGRIPSFSLFADGTVIYLVEGSTADQETVMEYQLSPEESLALLQQVLDFGFETLESHTDFCQDQGADEQICVADAATTILRARLPGGELHEVKIYHDFANEPQVFQDVTDLLNSYTNVNAEPYTPEGATLFIRQLQETAGAGFLEWPLDSDWLSRLDFAEEAMVAVPLTGEDLNQYLAVVPNNSGDAFFSQANKSYSAFLVPWLPGSDFSTEILAEFPEAEAAAASSNSPSTFEDCPVVEPVQAGLFRLAFIDNGDLWIWDEGIEPISLTSSGDVRQLKLSPSGEQVVFTRQPAQGFPELWVADPEQSGTQLLAGGSDLSGDIQILSFSSDEEMVAFIHYVDQSTGELWAANLDGSGSRLLVSTEDLLEISSETEAFSAIPAGVTWIPDTYLLTYDAQPTFENEGIYIFVQQQVWVVDAISGDQEALLPVGEGGNVSYSPDGRTMMITTPDSLRFMDLETLEIKPAAVDYFAVGFGEYYAFPTLAWSADSKVVLLAQPETKDYDQDLPVKIWQVPVDGSPAAQLLEVSGFFPTFSFSPGLEMVAYWKANASMPDFRELEISALDTAEQITYARSDLIEFIGWLPDTRHFIYALAGQGKSFVGDLCGEPVPLDVGFQPVGFRHLDASRFLFERPSTENLEVYEGHPDGTTILRLNIEDSRVYDAAILAGD